MSQIEISRGSRGPIDWSNALIIASIGFAGLINIAWAGFVAWLGWRCLRLFGVL